MKETGPTNASDKAKDIDGAEDGGGFALYYIGFSLVIIFCCICVYRIVRKREMMKL